MTSLVENPPDGFNVDDKDWLNWTLACGCEPWIEHCDQCDARRQFRKRLRLHVERGELVKRIQRIDAEFGGNTP